MHDPWSVAFEIRRPWPQRSSLFKHGLYWPSIFTIWHLDPRVLGDDSSCSNAYRFRHDPRHPNCYDTDALVRRACVLMTTEWWNSEIPWQWHVWHWHITWHFCSTLRRWLFTRCCKCGKHFSWGYTPCTDQWEAPKHRWWKSEVGLYHHSCSSPSEVSLPSKKEGT